jgi:hypothetical protein
VLGQLAPSTFQNWLAAGGNRCCTVVHMRAIAIAIACLIGASQGMSRPTGNRCCPVVELRQYTLKAGQRDTLIDVFDRYFIESQESDGMTVIGQFRDRQRLDRFVWMRGFPSMAGRHQALDRFYNGPVWAAHKTAANDTMLDSNDVLLLRPARPDMAFLIDDDAVRSPQTTPVVAAIYALGRPADETLVKLFETQVMPRLQTLGVGVQGVFVTETAPNTFTRLPVREGEHVLVWVGYDRRTDRSQKALAELATIATPNGVGAVPTLLYLGPTSRSRLGHGPDAARTTKPAFDFLQGS